jgi:hypothetical protein
MMALPDDLKDTNSQINNSDYWLITIPDLNPESITFDGKYNFIFRWQWEDGTYGKWSVAKEFITDLLPNLEVANLTSSWKVNTLTLKFTGPTVPVNDVQVEYADKFIIELTDIDSGRAHTFTQNIQGTGEQTFILDSKTAQEFYRPTSGNKTYQPTRFNGIIKVHSADGISTGFSFTTSTNSSGYSGKTIPNDAWGTVSVLDGYTISLDWDKLETAGILKESFAYVNFYEASAIGTEPNTSAGSFLFVKTGENGTLVYHPTSLLSHYVYIEIVDKSGNKTQPSSQKKVAALNPSGYDSTGPSNNNDITAGTPVIDGDGLFDFNYKVPFSWTPETDSTTMGYRLRWRINGSSDPYTYTLVPGKSTGTTYLFGVLAGQVYEVGKNTYDEYGNTTSAWKSTTVTIPDFTGEIKGTKYISAGDMKLGYGIGGNSTNKGLYLSTNNYWYVSGNTVADNAARIKIGSADSYIQWDGTDLTTTGIINALGGNFTGSVRVGSDTASGQLKVYVNSTTGIELGDFNQAIPSEIPGTVNSGIYAYAGNNYTLINAADGSIRTNNIYATGNLEAKRPDSNPYGQDGYARLSSETGALELLDESGNVRISLHSSLVNAGEHILSSGRGSSTLNGYPYHAPYISIVNTQPDGGSSKYIHIDSGWGDTGGYISVDSDGVNINKKLFISGNQTLSDESVKNIIISGGTTPPYASYLGTIWIQLG